LGVTSNGNFLQK